MRLHSSWQLGQRFITWSHCCWLHWSRRHTLRGRLLQGASPLPQTLAMYVPQDKHLITFRVCFEANRQAPHSRGSSPYVPSSESQSPHHRADSSQTDSHHHQDNAAVQGHVLFDYMKRCTKHVQYVSHCLGQRIDLVETFSLFLFNNNHPFYIGHSSVFAAVVLIGFCFNTYRGTTFPSYPKGHSLAFGLQQPSAVTWTGLTTAFSQMFT